MKTTANSGLAKVAVQCSAGSFVVNQRFVLRINICGESPALRQAQKVNYPAQQPSSQVLQIISKKNLHSYQF